MKNVIVQVTHELVISMPDDATKDEVKHFVNELDVKFENVDEVSKITDTEMLSMLISEGV